MTERLSARARRERSEILARETARALREKGCFRLRVDDVARAAGIGKGTVYLDHRDKASLVGASLARSCRDLIGELSRHADSIPDPHARFVAAARALARASVDRPDLGVLLERRLVCSARWVGADVAPYAQLVGHLGSVVEDALSAGGREPALDPDLAEAILGAVSMPAWRRIAVQDGPEHVVKALIQLMPSLFGAGDPEAGHRGHHRAPQGSA